MSQPFFSKERFGVLPSGDPISRYWLRGKGGLTLSFLDYGLTFVTLMMPCNKSNKPINLILGDENSQFYQQQPFYMGAIIGRYCNRLSPRILPYSADGLTLTENAPPFHLHGGEQGFDKKRWSVSSASAVGDEVAVTATLFSEHGDEGYPGNVTTTVTITIDADNRLRLDLLAETDRPTWISLTHHAYFNLSGSPTPVTEDHLIQINSTRVTAIDAQQRTTGVIDDVANTALDFKMAKTLATALQVGDPSFATTGGMDHNYVFKSHPTDQLRLMATLTCAATGMSLSVSATHPGMQFYSGQYLHADVPAAQHRYAPHSGLCFEPQYFPDSPCHPHFPSSLVTPTRPFKETIQYAISQ